MYGDVKLKFLPRQPNILVVSFGRHAKPTISGAI